MKIFTVCVVLIMFLVVNAMASDCGEKFERTRRDLISEITGKKSPGHVAIPHVFPTTKEMVEADLIHQINYLWQNNATIDKPRSVLLKAIAENAVRFEHHVVWNWRPSRCENPRTGSHSFLVIVRDKETGSELGRAALDESGLFEQMAFLGPDEMANFSAPVRTVGPLHTAKAELRKYARKESEAFLISSWGGLRCDVLNPCLAMNDVSRVLIMSAEQDIYEISGSAPRIPLNRIDREQPGANQRLMSVGHGQYSIAQRLGGPSPRH